jgi:TonB family protein
MSPRSLLFSSDQETSQLVGQVLRELGLEVEACSEIFSAIEKLTTKTFAVVVADLGDGAEANFLLKTCHELNATKSAMSVAIEGTGTVQAHPGVSIILERPLIADRMKRSLQQCEQLGASIKPQKPSVVPVPTKKTPVLPKGAFPKATLSKILSPKAAISKASAPSQPLLPATPLVLDQSPQTDSFAEPDLKPEHGLVPLAESASTKFKGTAHNISLTANARDLGFLNTENPLHVRNSRSEKTSKFSRIYRPGIMGAVLLWLAYIGVQPARSAELVSSVAVIYTRAVENTQSWLQEPKRKQADDEDIQLGEITVHRPRSTSLRVQTIHVGALNQSAVPNARQLAEPSPVAPVFEPAIPSSLKSSSAMVADDAAPAAVEAKLAPTSILSGMQPVMIPEEQSKAMVVNKIDPAYPLQALSSGLQGPVVLQAWIGKDGKVTELKLVRGYMLLGKAASDAVMQWHFRPYMQNGEPVEAQTYVTVNFKLPNIKPNTNLVSLFPKNNKE